MSEKIRSRSSSLSSGGSGRSSPHSTDVSWDSLSRHSKSKKKEKKSRKKDSIVLEEELFAHAKRLGKDSTKRLKKLLEKADPSTVFSQRTSSGQTLLHVLASEGQLDALKWLIETKGHDICFNMRDSTGGWTELHLATMEKRLDVIELLLDHNQVDPMVVSDSNGNIALHYLARHSFSEEEQVQANRIISRMLSRGVDINFENGLGETPLSWAVLKGTPQTVNFLLQRGADINSLNSFRETCMHYACRRGDVRVVMALMSHKAAPVILDVDGHEGTPLAVAMNYGHFNVVAFLNGFENEREFRKKTALLDGLRVAASSSFLRLCDISKVSLAAKTFRDAAQSESVWKKLFRLKFPMLYQRLAGNLSIIWKDEYKNALTGENYMPDDLLNASINLIPFLEKSPTTGMKITKSTSKVVKELLKSSSASELPPPVSANQLHWNLKLEEQVKELKDEISALRRQLNDEKDKRTHLEKLVHENSASPKISPVIGKGRNPSISESPELAVPTAVLKPGIPKPIPSVLEPNPGAFTPVSPRPERSLSDSSSSSFSSLSRTSSASAPTTPLRYVPISRAVSAPVPPVAPVPSPEAAGSVEELRDLLRGPIEDFKAQLNSSHLRPEVDTPSSLDGAFSQLERKIVLQMEKVANEIRSQFRTELDQTKREIRRSLIKEQIMMELNSNRKTRRDSDPLLSSSSPGESPITSPSRPIRTLTFTAPINIPIASELATTSPAPLTTSSLQTPTKSKSAVLLSSLVRKEHK
eukprot:TRINITY_DN6258_c0_g1_i2.p1 TRINITY_DN6258_c0_g1~~TRINITY_DN6258_c0_g1_i2.p1  ORF type:complete len:756 (+),score=189.27 TRINITY_DN6258_c0_g1_i2:230-2497(+)